jgi:hypothetical protein
MTFKYPQIFQQYLLYETNQKYHIYTHDFHVNSLDQQGLMVNGFHCGEERKKNDISAFALENH